MRRANGVASVVVTFSRTHGTRAEVARRLTGLVKPFGSVSREHVWMPRGFEHTDEVQLHKPNALISAETAVGRAQGAGRSRIHSG